MTAVPPDDEMRALPSAEAKELAEIHLLVHDLAYAVRALKILIDHADDRQFSDEENDDIRLALYRDALVQFIACFDGTAPIFLKVPDVYPGDPNAQSYFDSLKDLRDSFAAHRHGPARQCVVGVVAGPAEKPMGIGRMMARVHVPTLIELKHTHAFVWKAWQHSSKRAADVEAEVTERAMAMSRDQILALPGAHLYNVRPEEMRSGRESFARKRAKADTAKAANRD